MSESFGNFPRGTPYKPPPESEPRSVPDVALRGFAVKLALGTLLAVMLIVGVGAFIIIRAVRPTAPPAGLITGLASGANETKSTPVAPDFTARDTKPAERETPTMPKEKPPVEKKAPPPPRDLLLDAVAGLLATDLHQGYLNIGLLADAQENDIYSPEDAKKVLASITALLDGVDQQVGNLTSAGLDEEDRKKLELARKITGLLRTQAKELRAYWETSDKDKEAKKDHETKYFKAREDAWSGIKELLEIKE